MEQRLLLSGPCTSSIEGDAITDLKELVITKDDYLKFLSQRLQLRGSCQREIENLNFPFLFASGSELLRTYILGASEFTATLADRYRLPDRGFIWFLFSQALREVQIMPDKVIIKYEIQEDYRKPFKMFYL
jgi:hypothetical protein